MPGMMETVLDVGLNFITVAGLVRMTGNPRLARDSYRLLVQGYAEVVAGPSHGAVRIVGGRCAETGGRGNRTLTRSSRSSRPDREDAGLLSKPGPRSLSEQSS
jgi:hypothetical protein